MESKLKVVIEKDDSQLKELLESLANLQSLFGGAIPSAVKKASSAAKESFAKIQEDAVQTGAKMAAAAEKAARKEEDLVKAKAAAEEKAEAAIAENAKKYAELKASYSIKSLDQVRDAIMKGEEATRVVRRTQADEEDKLVKQSLQKKINQSQKELQLFRSLEKEKIGRTFSEQMERLQLEEKSNREIKVLLEKQNTEFAEIQHKMTVSQSEEEQKRLAGEKKTLAAELAATKEEFERRGLAAKEEAKQERQKEAGGGMSGMVAGIVGGGAILGGIELVKKASEKAEEFNKSQLQLQQSTGLTGEALNKQGESAEKLGIKYGVSGDAAKGMEGTIHGATGKIGADLDKQTEAIIAYAATHKRADQTVEEAAARIMKQYGTNAQMRSLIDSQAAENEKNAMSAMNNPAMIMQKAMAQMQDTIGKVAATVVNSLAPALTAVGPVLDALGNVVSAVLGPAMQVLTPVFDEISSALKDLMPPISELLQAGLGALMPVMGIFTGILKDIIPVFETIVKTLATALTPVFKALTPVIQEIADMINQLVGSGLQALFIPTLNILLPILTNLLVPVLTSLMPLLKMIADIVSAVLTPTLNALSGILNWLVTNAIQPVVTWLTGQLATAINDTVGQITKAVGAITSVISSVGSFLGLGSKAADAAKDTGTKAVADQKDTNEKLINGAKAFTIAEESELKDRIMTHSVTRQEMKAAELRAEQTGNEELLRYLQHQEVTLFAAKKNGHVKEIKAAKDEYTAEKQALDEALEERKTDIEIDLVEGRITQQQAHMQDLEAQQKHDSDMLALADISAKDKKTATLKTLQDNAAIHKQGFDDEKTAIESKEADDIEAAGDDARKVNQIKLQALKDELASAAAHGQDTIALKKQISVMELSIDKDTRKQSRAIQDELQASSLSSQKEYLAQKKAMLQSEGKSTAEVDVQLEKLAEDEEDERYRKELESRKSDLADVKMGQALRESLEANHQNKLSAIQANALAQQKKAWEQNNAYLIGPVTNAFQSAGNFIDKKFFAPLIANTLGTKTLFGQMASQIVGDLIKMGVQFVTQQALMLAESLVFHAGSTAAATAAGTATAAAYAPAATLASIMSFGAADLAGTAGLTGALAAGNALAQIKFAAAGSMFTSDSPYIVGELGPEVVNPPRGSQIIPNHLLNGGGAAPIDLSPLVSRLDMIHAGIQQSNKTFQMRPGSVLPINDRFDVAYNGYHKAEARRSF